ncbi:MAG: molybdopterin-dependent oxidoreductase [Pseudolabrys sp.]
MAAPTVGPSAGRFHHAQSQIHRFLNCIGGYTSSFSNYSHAAADVIVPHVIGDRRGLFTHHTPWSLIVGHAKLIVMFGGTSHKNAQVSSGGISAHTLRGSLGACKKAGADFVSIRSRSVRYATIHSDEFNAEWMPLRPNTDVALMLGVAHTLIAEDLFDRAFVERYTSGFARFRAYVMGESDGVAKAAEWAAGVSEIPADAIRSLGAAHEGAAHLHHDVVVTATRRSRRAALLAGGHARRDARPNRLTRRRVRLWATPRSTASATPSNPLQLAVAAARHQCRSRVHSGSACVGHAAASRRSLRFQRPAPHVSRYPAGVLGGGNPFHHHQDLNRLVQAWKKPEVIVVHDSCGIR